MFAGARHVGVVKRLPSLAVLLLGLALTARDGVVVLLAVATFSGSVVLMVKMLPKVAQLWPF